MFAAILKGHCYNSRASLLDLHAAFHRFLSDAASFISSTVLNFVSSSNEPGMKGATSDDTFALFCDRPFLSRDRDSYTVIDNIE